MQTFLSVRVLLGIWLAIFSLTDTTPPRTSRHYSVAIQAAKCAAPRYSVRRHAPESAVLWTNGSEEPSARRLAEPYSRLAELNFWAIVELSTSRIVKTAW